MPWSNAVVLIVLIVGVSITIIECVAAIADSRKYLKNDIILILGDILKRMDRFEVLLIDGPPDDDGGEPIEVSNKEDTKIHELKRRA